MKSRELANPHKQPSKNTRVLDCLRERVAIKGFLHVLEYISTFSKKYI